MLENLFPATRLEAFSDGVLAVIITIMVLELKAPHQDGLTGLLSLAPTLFIYLLSFTLTGIYWINHHHLINRVEEVDHRVLYTNLGFLFSASLMPFFTSYLIEKKSDSLSVTLYAASMIFSALTFMLLRLAVRRLLTQAGRLQEQDVATQRKHYLSLGLYLIAIPLARFHSYTALSIIAFVTFVWIYPTARVETCPPGHQPHRGETV